MDFTVKFLQDGLDPKENKALYDAVIFNKPDVVFEVGMRRGGGSTYYIASAMAENGKGMLHTIECDPECHAQAIRLYDRQLKHLSKYVTKYLGKSHEVFPAVLSKIDKVDIVFLDGEENANSTMREFEMFLPKIPVGGILACHDWNIHKMEKLRPLLEKSQDWMPMVKIMDTLTCFAMHRRSR
jgi:predicted O-methyltransferase YrrM